MGVFSFIKEAGEKIFGIEKEESEKPTEDTQDTREMARRENEKAARQLKRTISDLKLKTEDLRISIEEDKAVIRGKAESQSTREKIVLLVGNSQGIAKVNDQMTVEKEGAKAGFHTVATGDTLGRIAKEHYGDENKYPVIFEANKPMLEDPDRIYRGQVLRIPQLEKN